MKDFKLFSDDTSLEAYKVQLAVLKKMGAEKRLNLGFQLNEELRRITELGIRAQHPEYSEEKIRLTYIKRNLGKELFKKAFKDRDVDI